MRKIISNVVLAIGCAIERWLSKRSGDYERRVLQILATGRGWMDANEIIAAPDGKGLYRKIHYVLAGLQGQDWVIFRLETRRECLREGRGYRRSLYRITQKGIDHLIDLEQHGTQQTA